MDFSISLFPFGKEAYVLGICISVPWSFPLMCDKMYSKEAAEKQMEKHRTMVEG